MKKLKKLVLFIGLLIIVPAATTFALGVFFQENDFNLFYCISSFSFLICYLFSNQLIRKIFETVTTKEYIFLFACGYLLMIMFLYLVYHLS